MNQKNPSTPLSEVKPPDSPHQDWARVREVWAQHFDEPLPQAFTLETMGPLLLTVAAAGGPDVEVDLDHLIADAPVSITRPACELLLGMTDISKNHWAQLMMADAALASPALPRPWILPSGPTQLGRLVEAAGCADWTDRFIRTFVMASPCFTDSAKAIARDINEWQRALTPSGTDGEAWLPGRSNPSLARTQQATRLQDLPGTIALWLEYVEATVRSSLQGKITVTTAPVSRSAMNSDVLRSMPPVVTMDLHPTSEGVQYGYQDEHRLGLEEFVTTALEKECGLAVVLRIFSDKERDVLDAPIKIVQGWFIAPGLAEPDVTGLSADEIQQCSETELDPKQKRDPQLGVWYTAAPSFAPPWS